MKYALAAMVFLFACSGDDVQVIDASTDADAAVDGTPPDCGCSDAPIDTPPTPSPVQIVACPADPNDIASVVTAPGFSFTITEPVITTGSIVRFTMPGSHNAASGTVTGGVPTHDGLFRVMFGTTVCLQFTEPGTYPFYCEPHQFTGSLTVNDPV